MNVIEFPKDSKNEERKEALLEVIEELKQRVENDEIREFIACSLDHDGKEFLHVSTSSLPCGVGLFEIGKVMLMDFYSELE